MDPRAEAMLDELGGDAASARLVRAPGRVNLIGDHTDYNSGWCLPLAIDRDCWVAVRAVDAPRVRARSLDVAGEVRFDPGSVAVSALEPRWGRFVAGAARVETLAAGTGLDAVVASTVPVGSGLSSSAALCVALVVAFGADRRDPRRVARDAREAEVLATGVPVGLMDQLVSVLGAAGAALLLDCGELDAEPIRLPSTLAVGVVHSGVRRTLAASDYAARRAACEAAARRLGRATLRHATLEEVADDPLARHVVTENRRVLAAADALRAGDAAALGTLLVESHTSLRDDFAVSTPELDLLVELLVDEGAYGARLTGAGFGGCVVALTRPEDRAERARPGRRPVPGPHRPGARGAGGGGGRRGGTGAPQLSAARSRPSASGVRVPHQNRSRPSSRRTSTPGSAVASSSRWRDRNGYGSDGSSARPGRAERTASSSTVGYRSAGSPTATSVTPRCPRTDAP